MLSLKTMHKLVLNSNVYQVKQPIKKDRYTLLFEKELEKIGLGVPQPAKVIHQLKEAGADIKGEPVTAEESIEAIYKWLSKEAL